MAETILILGESSSSLVVEAEADDKVPWAYNLTFRVRAWPFEGTLCGMMSDTYLEELRDELRTDPLPAQLHLGRDRSIELILDVDEPYGGERTDYGFTAKLSWTGDDPFPSITWMLGSTPPDFAEQAADAIDRLLAAEG
ncbi:hypothetical protein J4H92_02950 [Leucobacter weissii]|uniref:Uncharacterized protein n=1 Tax=Leucobacter weissii TaxID=1983706 RepID=A0A939MIK1_9MICO|nr:hypothetical protein [Leucobacter weissii]MBO1900905.1 hypothetical protein [Leucobacter weissii]